MTVDEVAADVGIAKASLYKHFPSKEALAAAAMVRLLQRTLAVVEQQAARAEATPLQRLRGGDALGAGAAAGRRDADAAVAELLAARRADGAARPTSTC